MMCLTHQTQTNLSLASTKTISKYFLKVNNGDIISKYFRSELDLNKTELPAKDIKILNLLVKK